MGVIQNVHTGGSAPERAMAERIATLRARSLAKILEATAFFDEAGQHYWESEYIAEQEACLKASVETARRAFDLLRQARKGLLESSQEDILFEDAHELSPRLIKAREMRLDEYEYKTRRFLGERLAYDRRIVDLIDHLLITEETALQGLGQGNLRAIYVAVSSASRQLVEVAAEHIQRITAASRVTHEVAYTVEMVWEMEKQPNLTLGHEGSILTPSKTHERLPSS